jgi:hypothetical protein
VNAADDQAAAAGHQQADRVERGVDGHGAYRPAGSATSPGVPRCW